MKYLLDVNALLALCYEKHVHHIRTERWLGDLEIRAPSVNLATCSTTELGFVRISSGVARLAPNVKSALDDLKDLKREWEFIFLDDTLGAQGLPPWVERSRQVTDGHLIMLAAVNHGTLATLDTGIPGALLIPEYPECSSVVRQPELPYGIPSVWQDENFYTAAPRYDSCIGPSQPS
jgi:predicted nucleic acid-binding protein